MVCERLVNAREKDKILEKIFSILNSMTMGDFSEKVGLVKSRSTEEREKHTSSKKRFSGTGTSKCKGPVAARHPACWRTTSVSPGEAGSR